MIDEKTLAILEGIVGELPGIEGWNKNGEQTFFIHAQLLYEKGLPFDDIENILKALWIAVAKEFGA